MKILQIHKYYSPKKGGGGVTAFFEIIKILKKNKHKVSIFSMKDKTNTKTRYSKYFTNFFDLNKKQNFFQKIKLASKLIYNFEAKNRLKKLIEKEKPQIAHIHDIYHYLSSSVITTLHENKIPIVYTLHDYKLICPNYKLFNKGKICEKCKNKKYYNAFINKCLKDSWISSFLIMTEAYFNKIFNNYEKIDLFIAPSHFIKNKFIEFGFPEKKIKVIRNIFDSKKFVDNSTENLIKDGNYALYYGRLSEEKGIKDLINAFNQIKDSKLKLKIVGHGPQENELKKLSIDKKTLKFEGFKQGSELKKIIARSKFVIVPSIWYDNSPMVILESQMLKKPIIVSDLGGSKESIIDEKTGLLFKAHNIKDLTQKIDQVNSLTKQKRIKMGKFGQENIKKIFNEEDIYEQLIKSYQEAISFTQKTHKKD